MLTSSLAGVEAGKKAAAEVLALQKRVLTVLNNASAPESVGCCMDSPRNPVEALTAEEVAKRCQVPQQVGMVYKIISHMAASGRAVFAEGNCGTLPKKFHCVLRECEVEDLYDD